MSGRRELTTEAREVLRYHFNEIALILAEHHTCGFTCAIEARGVRYSFLVNSKETRRPQERPR